MSILIRQTATSTAGFNGSNAVSFASTPSVGNAVIALITAQTVKTVTLIDNQSGNTYSPVVQASDSGGGYFHADAEIWWCPVLSSASGTFTVTGNSATGGGEHRAIVIMEVSGLGNTVDQSGSASDVGAASTSLTVSCSGTNTNINDLVVAVINSNAGDSGGNATYPPTSLYTALLYSNPNATGVSMTSGYKLLTGGETSSAAASWTTASWCAGAIATFKPLFVPPTNGYWSSSDEYF
jgi:hypothetical protein